VYTTWIITRYGLQAHSWQFIPGFIISGIGLSLIMIPIFSAALQDVDVAHAGSASGILNAVQQVGAAIGIAIIGVIFFSQLAHSSYQSFDDIAPKLNTELSAAGVPAEVQGAIIAQTRTCFHDRNTEKDNSVVPESCKQALSSAPNDQAAQRIGAIIGKGALEANARNFASAFRASVIYVILLLVVISALSLTLPRKFKMVEGH
jgi:hypothetical protein